MTTCRRILFPHLREYLDTRRLYASEESCDRLVRQIRAAQADLQHELECMAREAHEAREALHHETRHHGAAPCSACQDSGFTTIANRQQRCPWGCPMAVEGV